MAEKITPLRKSNKSSQTEHTSTGPKTAGGKERSSQNAVIHGATSPKLLTDAEKKTYAILLSELQAEYTSKNPLVRMQLERIARLKVQLDRIQDVIDASFEAERRSKPNFERASDILALTDSERSQMARWLIDRMQGEKPEGLVDQELLTVSLELSEIDEYGLLTTHEDIELYLPSFCKYIIDQATDRNQTLGDYLSTRQIDLAKFEDPPKGKKLPDPSKLTFRIIFPDAPKEPEPQPELRDVSVKTLQLSAAWFRLETWEFMKKIFRMREMSALAEVTQEAALPDPEKLDRLMRYQTTINRQLSSAMGELLELTRRG